MNIERRLHHAARELREVTIDVPPLDELGSRPRSNARPRPRLAALAAPVLFVAGGVLAIGVMQRPEPAPLHSDFAGVIATDVGTGTTADITGPAVSPPSVREELRMIRGVVEATPAPADVAPVEPPATAAGPN